MNNTGILTLLTSLFIFVSSSLHASSDNSSNNSSDQAIEESNKSLKTIVVTLKPIYSLVAHLTDGISTPTLLSNNMQSPHHHNLRPSERRLIDNADMIIWLGPAMETYLEKIIQQKNGLSLPLIQTKNLNLLYKRSKHSHHKTHQNSLVTNKIDPHIWLSTNNVKIISRHISTELIAFDKKNTERYKKNLENLLNKIEKTDNEIRHTLKNSKQPFIVAHDAFQYFEKEYGLNYIAALNSGEDTNTSLKHLREINSLIKKNNIQCIVYQQPKPALIDTLTRNTDIKKVALDPLGLDSNNNYHAWFEIMQSLAINFKQCLDL